MNPIVEHNLIATRRQLLTNTGFSAGSIALAMLAGERRSDASESDGDLERGFRIPAKAKSLIYLHMNGGPSQIEMWDYKPILEDYFNQEIPNSIRNGQRLTTLTSGQLSLPIAPSKYSFSQQGECGRWICELLPYTAAVVDDLALVKTVVTHAINHDPGCTYVMTGSEVPGKASLGSWLSYGLGSESQNLPAFVVLTPTWSSGEAAQALFTRMWSSGFLPASHAGVVLRSAGDPVLYVQNPPGVERRDRRTMLDALSALNQQHHSLMGDPDIQTRIAQFEMAFRMQSSVPELVDLTSETKATLEMYGPDVLTPGTFASSALLARRMVERGVRVVKVLHRGWDQHASLPRYLPSQCKDTDQATAALIADLKQRGLLDSTLVVWGGEFGRTVYTQGKLTREDYGRDHHPRNFCMWLAGGGIKAGISLGETDDFSYNVVDRPVPVSDLNATILHCMGIDHEKLTFKFQGLQQRLTGVENPKVVLELLES